MHFIRDRRGFYWEPEATTASMLPYEVPNLTHFTTVAHENSTLLLGGLLSSTVSTVYELTKTEIKSRTSMLVARGDFCAVSVGSQVVVIGGHNFENRLDLALCEVMDGNKWKFYPSLHVARRAASACELNSCIYVFGGDGLNTIESLALGEKAWRISSLKLPEPLKQVGVCKVDDSTVIILGGVKLNDQPTTEVLLFKSGKTWKVLRSLDTPTRSSVPPILHDCEVMLFDQETTVKYSLEASDISPFHRKTVPRASPRIDLTEPNIEETEANFSNGVLKLRPYSNRYYRYFLNPNPSVLVIKKLGCDGDCIDALKQVVSSLLKLNCQVFIEAACVDHVDNCSVFTQPEFQKIDLIVAIGGDGTVIWASSLFRYTNMPPIVAFNMVRPKQGSLGFLTRYCIEEYEEVLTEVLQRDNFKVDVSCRLEAWVESGGLKEYKGQATNEFVVDRGPSPSILGIDISLDDIHMTTAYGDGLIVSTPLGSTGYSLSAGGSIVHPDVPGILVSPICPHSLSFRPLLLPDSSVLRLTIPRTSRCDAWIGIDGQTRFLLPIGSSLIIQMSSFPIPRNL
jgi:NAD kinase